MTPTESVRKKLLACCLPALRRLPTRFAGRVLGGLGAFELRLNPARRARFAGAVRRCADRLGCTWEVGPLADRLAGNTLRWHARDYLLEHLTSDQAGAVLTIDGRAHFDEALALGRGVVLLFNHFGPFLIPAHWLVRNDYTLRWFTERPRHISRLISETFRSEGPLGQRDLFLSRKLNASQGGLALRRAVRMLGAGYVVQAAGDVRWDGPRCVPARFLGQTYRFTTNWVCLAARSGAPVVPVFALMNPDGGYRVEFLEAEQVGPDDAQPERAVAWVQRNLNRLEAWIRAHPDNSGDYAFWTA
jgi:lauroyl/myristoyl acyltransferase